MIYAVKIIVVALLSYLAGNFNSAIAISKLKKNDIRKLGSGNPGTMNMFRNFGKGIGLLTLGLDALKGIIPCLMGWFVCGEAWRFGADKIGLYTGGLSVIVGHIFPVFYKFHGGKGIASSVGVCLVINWWATLISFTVGALFLIFIKIGSITSFIIISFPIALNAFSLASESGTLACRALLFALFCLTLFAHTKNVFKLCAGTERKVILFGRHKNKNKTT
ncbi:MAG: hypothetical protein HFE35_08275 [Clostridia bacterium]|uniref:glycerol-3-phosphate acyltransferase n=1 Tax=Pumilibacter muris TaxID=2941510 RepID=UPI00204202BA|nr:glycerol-3-phosphate acyltransferase [Pumilibacter muris]MCI8596784.1 hypothetical protein [Clostridia bacterium]